MLEMLNTCSLDIIGNVNECLIEMTLMVIMLSKTNTEELDIFKSMKALNLSIFC